MLHQKKIVVVMPAYNAAKTLELTYSEIPKDVVDEVILVDDASRDDTAFKAGELGIHTIIHPENRGYGGNQKTCYEAALSRGADVVVMLHPDYQYSPRLITAMSSMILSGHYDLALGAKLSEYHTGFRAFSRRVLETLPLEENSDDFVFDNEILAQAVYFGFRIGEISCPTKYFDGASSISFRRSVKYGFGVLTTSLKFLLMKSGLVRSSLFRKREQRR
jgi:glycosyltransferase involved in cell wall biosynthesis